MSGATPATAYRLDEAWVDGRVQRDVLVTIADGRFTSVEVAGRPGAGRPVAGADQPSQPERLPGLTLPGLANCHSHAFHRALRGRTQTGSGSFWSWRDQMYDLAGRLDPDSYRHLATAVFREMVAAGVTTVGEFHYLHHRPDGSAYDDVNAMGLALVEAARAAGLRIALLDTCYLTAGIGEPVQGVQRRFSDGSATAWQERTDELTAEDGGDVVVGAAVHSVRAVPLDDIRLVAEWADRFETPVHVHLSEQVAENEQCWDAYGRTPAELLAEAGLLCDRTTVVHATHLTDSDVHRIGSTGTSACLCPTTERDLGDGIGPARALVAAGARLTLGSDSHAVVDLFEEMRAVEMHERLGTMQRGHFAAADLIRAASADGHASLGFPDAGRIAVGARADLVTLDLTSPRTAGTGGGAETAVFAATSADVVQVVSGGRVVHRAEEAADVGRALARAIEEVWS